MKPLLLQWPCFVLVDENGRIPTAKLCDAENSIYDPCVYSRRDWAERANERRGNKYRIVEAVTTITEQLTDEPVIVPATTKGAD